MEERRYKYKYGKREEISGRERIGDKQVRKGEKRRGEERCVGERTIRKQSGWNNRRRT